MSDNLEQLRARAEGGDPIAQFELGQRHDTGIGAPQDFELARSLYTQAAGMGVTGAMYNLGVLYDHGRGVEQDYEEAMRWYTKAAEAGDSWAQNNIGFMYSHGRGVEQDEDLALEWYRRAAEGGHFGARYNLGVRYTHGNGVEQDYSTAHMWFTIAQTNCTPVEHERAKKVKEALEEAMDDEEKTRTAQLFSSWKSDQDSQFFN